MFPDKSLSRVFKILNPPSQTPKLLRATLARPGPTHPKKILNLILKGAGGLFFLTSCVTPLELKNSSAPVLHWEGTAPLSPQGVQSRGEPSPADSKRVHISVPSFFWGGGGPDFEVQVQDLCLTWEKIHITRTFGQQMVLLFSLGMVSPVSVFLTCSPDRQETPSETPLDPGKPPLP